MVWSLVWWEKKVHPRHQTIILVYSLLQDLILVLHCRLIVPNLNHSCSICISSRVLSMTILAKKHFQWHECTIFFLSDSILVVSMLSISSLMRWTIGLEESHLKKCICQQGWHCADWTCCSQRYHHQQQDLLMNRIALYFFPTYILLICA